MLLDNDLERFLSIYNDVISENSIIDTSEQAILRPQANGLFPAEVRRLSRSVAIASVLGDAPEDAASTIQEIWRSLDRGLRYAPLDDIAAWQQAIRHVKEQVDTPGEIPSVLGRISRETQVGSACLRLRTMGFGVHVGAYGPIIDDESQEAICSKIDDHLSLIGGLDCINQICRFFHETNRIHDGMWLFGDRVPGVFQVAAPAAPLG